MTTPNIVSFDDAMKMVANASKRHLLLGNGFSIALKPDIFSYGSLYENADFSKAPNIPDVFKSLGTQDFEVVIRRLQDAATVIEVYRPELKALASQLRTDCSTVKDALVAAIAKRHPDRPYDITPQQYASCRTFLSKFDHIFTLNYDVLLYWALMQSEVDKLELKPDDGFRHPEQGVDLPYVSWQQANSATIQYLHGALHLFDQDTEIVKYTWSKTDRAIVDQVREALNENKYPLFVAEGTTESKVDRILHNAYLHKALRSFESCCSNSRNAIVIYGHSLADNDKHILKCISHGSAFALLVGVYGDPESDANKFLLKNAEQIGTDRGRARGDRYPLKMIFYNASTARVWG